MLKKILALMALSAVFISADTKNVVGVVHPIGALFNDGGAVLQVGETIYFSPGVACKVYNWRGTVIGTSSPSVTIDVWKLTNAYPTISNSITAAAVPVVSGTTPGFSGLVSTWTQNFSVNDTVAFNIKAISGSPTQASLVLGCK